MNIALVCQQRLFGDGVAALLQGLGEAVEVHQWTPAEQPPACSPLELAVIDIESLGANAADVVRDLRAELQAPIVAIAGVLDENQMASILEAGASAYITKAFGRDQALDVMRRAIVNPAANGLTQVAAPRRRGRPSKRFSTLNPYNLTRAEVNVLALITEGQTNLSISKRLGIKESTVKLHAHNIYKKLGTDNRTQAAKIGARMDVIRAFLQERAVRGASLCEWLLPHMTDEFYRKGAVLFKKGDPGQALYYIQEGQIALQEIGEVAQEGELLGEIGIFAPERARTCTARCETDTKLFRLTADQAKRLYIEHPEFAYHVVQLIAQRMTKSRLPGTPTSR